MCFSSQASFFAGAALVVCSVATLRLAWSQSLRYVPLAAFPLFFGIQQIAEGVLWLSFDWPAGPSVAAGQVFLFVAYLIWPALVAMSAALIEPDAGRRRLFLRIGQGGALLGVVLYLPVLIWPAGMDIHLVEHSIRYASPNLFPPPKLDVAGRLIYATIICVPLIGSSHPALRSFGYLVLGSVVIGFVFAAHAFTSIWCFLAAGLSSYIWVVLRGLVADPQAPLSLGKA